MRSKNVPPVIKLMRLRHRVFKNITYKTYEGLVKYREAQSTLCRRLSPKKGLIQEKVNVEGMAAMWTVPDEIQSEEIVLYCHGGGFMCGDLDYAAIIAGKLALSLGRRVFSYDYRLSPENEYPAAIEDTLTAWEYIVAEGNAAEKIDVVGDSAGGNLVLELCLELKNRGNAMPRSIVLLSPWTDMTMSSKSYEKYEDTDPILDRDYIMTARQYYLGERQDYDNPKFSPLNAELTDLPRTLIQVGEYEVLADDSRRLAEKLNKAGVDTVLHRFPGGWHVFHQLPIKPSEIAFTDIADFLR